jgi:hypothetical protein
MNWNNVREKYPNAWVLIEAIEAESQSGERIVHRMSVLNYFDSSIEANQEYIILHKKYPEKEMYVYHTQNEKLQIKERIWMGVRSR